ncbi:hypothetical protein J5N97_003312 [Dioscorea zingiberensis]|uniref:Trehalose-phosphatase n=1 Tax=Dioscorea zingiberensis TaxID=325984 RepID=A0A9D5D4E7_9LILI|nr:hypothetical protein J5N97_003312 [Dioscorea zingiberensis]
MPSRSSANLLDLAESNSDYADPTRHHSPRLPRVLTLPNVLPDDSLDSPPPSPSLTRRILVNHRLPLRVSPPVPPSRLPSFSLDPDSLSILLLSGLPESCPVIHVGTIPLFVSPDLQDEVADLLFTRFHCVPVFVSPEIHSLFYHSFCKRHLWPLLHSQLPLAGSAGGATPFPPNLWRAFVSANKLFADKVLEVANPDDDLVWAHDYHLMALPTFLRRRSPRIKLGFFLHSPFPSSEIFKTLPAREELLRALLNADLVGFHTFDYARHFLSCCSRLLGLDYASNRGHLAIEYYGRTVTVKIVPTGIHVGRPHSIAEASGTKSKASELVARYAGKIVLLGIDDMDLLKGIGLKFLAMERLLEDHPALCRKVVFVQIANPARSHGTDMQRVQDETHSLAARINARFGYDAIVLIDGPVPTPEKVAYYAIAECCVVNCIRDGLNLVPYKYTACRQWSPALEGKPKKSVIVVSEFIGCSPSLSGAIRVNPWNVDDVAEAMNLAITMPEAEKQLRHEKHYKYVSSHDVAYWARSFDQDLQRACKDHYLKRCWGIGFGLSFRVVALGPNFRRLSVEHIASAYRRTSSRLILLDYDGTMMPQPSISNTPSDEVISVLNGLSADPKNVVFVVSGRGKDSLSKWFASCEKLGISAEHGYFTRWSRDSPWESCMIPADFDWKKIAEPVMRLYTEATDGSYIEHKESALVWHHQDADPDFGSCQAKELLDHLENVLANEPVVVKRGQHIVEVNPQGISKGIVVQNLISTMLNRGKPPDFVLCIGDDRSDEDMFESIMSSVKNPSLPATAEVFACTVGKKPSKAKYYLDDTVDVIKLLQGLATASTQPPRSAPLQVSFEGLL